MRLFAERFACLFVLKPTVSECTDPTTPCAVAARLEVAPHQLFYFAITEPVLGSYVLEAHMVRQRKRYHFTDIARRQMVWSLFAHEVGIRGSCVES